MNVNFAKEDRCQFFIFSNPISIFSDFVDFKENTGIEKTVQTISIQEKVTVAPAWLHFLKTTYKNKKHLIVSYIISFVPMWYMHFKTFTSSSLRICFNHKRKKTSFKGSYLNEFLYWYSQTLQFFPLMSSMYN